MARSAVFDSLAPLVDYLNRDNPVSLSTLADYLTTEDENRQVSLSGLVDAAQRGYRPQSKFEQDVVKPTMDFAIDKMAPKIGEMAKATPAGIGAIVTEDIPAMVGRRRWIWLIHWRYRLRNAWELAGKRVPWCARVSVGWRIL